MNYISYLMAPFMPPEYVMTGKTILLNRRLRRISKKEMADLLKISLEDFVKIETGEKNLTTQQNNYLKQLFN